MIGTLLLIVAFVLYLTAVAAYRHLTDNTLLGWTRIRGELDEEEGPCRTMSPSKQ